MILSACRSRPCLICTFKIAEWLAPSLSKVTACKNKVDQHHTQLAHFSTKTPSYRTNPGNIKIIRQTSKSRHDWKPPNAPTAKYRIFEDLVLNHLRGVINEFQWTDPRHEALLNIWGIRTEYELNSKATQFRFAISRSFEQAEKFEHTSKENNPLYYRLRKAFIEGDVKGLHRDIQTALLVSAVDLKFSDEDLGNQKRIADLRYPVEWFPATRAIQRKIHLHVGPTNSGKTYHALKSLEAAKTGIYAGPLRLLAHEVYTRFNAKGKPCALITGEERRYPENLKVAMSSCTVEMVPLNMKVDVAVIDEIQMIADPERGWAWTQAFLGVQATEVHLCGEARTVPLIKELCAEMGDELEIHEYERLSPLETSGKHLGGLKNLQKGDAIIVFSRIGIHAMKKEVERTTGKRCAIVYGSLPPETRAQQANLFNDPNSDYDFLVASDAIGMGLNLAIKRVIFESTEKRNGLGGYEILEDSAIKQIGGRAGRFKTAHDAVQGAVTDGLEAGLDSEADMSEHTSEVESPKESVGIVTSLDRIDLDVVRKAMTAEIKPVKQAGIFPPSSVINRFASFFPQNTPFSYVILRLHDLAATSPRFRICNLKDQLGIADALHGFRLTTNDRLIFMAAPATLRDSGMFAAVQEMAQWVAEQKSGDVLDLKCLKLELLDTEVHRILKAEQLRNLESMHKIITLYLWLSYRFTGVFRNQSLAFHVKSLTEQKIDLFLQDVNWDDEQRQRDRATARARMEKSAKIKANIASETLAELPIQLEDGETLNKQLDEFDVSSGSETRNQLSDSESFEKTLDQKIVVELPDTMASTLGVSLPNEVPQVLEHGPSEKISDSVAS